MGSYVCPKCYQRQYTIGPWKAKLLRIFNSFVLFIAGEKQHN